MPLKGLLVSAGDATSNPDPNTLGTKNPYSSSDPTDLFSVAAAWTTQAKLAMFPLGARDGGGKLPLRLHFIPSSGSAVTYTVTVWFYSPINNSWYKPANASSNSYTGECEDYIENPPEGTPVFLQLSSISAGTIKIYADAGVAELH